MCPPRLGAIIILAGRKERRPNMKNKNPIAVIALLILYSSSYIPAAAQAQYGIDFDRAIPVREIVRKTGAEAKASPVIPAAPAAEQTVSDTEFYDRTKVARIWPHIYIVPQGNYEELSRVMQQTREGVRNGLWDRFSETLISLAQAEADVAKMAPVLLNAMLIFDNKYAEYMAHAKNGIPESLESQRIADVEQ